MAIGRPTSGNVYIWSALQHCGLLHFRKLLGMPLDFEKVISEQFPQYKLSQHANMLAASFIHVTSFTLVLKNHSFGGTHSEADTAQRALKIRLHLFFFFSKINAISTFLPSTSSCHRWTRGSFASSPLWWRCLRTPSQFSPAQMRPFSPADKNQIRSLLCAMQSNVNYKVYCAM